MSGVRTNTDGRRLLRQHGPWPSALRRPSRVVKSGGGGGETWARSKRAIGRLVSRRRARAATHTNHTKTFGERPRPRAAGPLLPSGPRPRALPPFCLPPPLTPASLLRSPAHRLRALSLASTLPHQCRRGGIHPHPIPRAPGTPPRPHTPYLLPRRSSAPTSPHGPRSLTQQFTCPN